MAEDQSSTEPFIEHDEQLERVRWFYSSRVDAEGKVPRGLIARASAQRRRMALEFPIFAVPGGPGSVNWTPLGPSVVAHGQASGFPAVNGRFTALAVGPGGSRIYAGAANGGVWFSSDGGANWGPIDDYSTSPGFLSGMEADSLSVGAIAVRFGANAASDAIFVGTGEPQSRSDQPYGDGYFGIGVRYSARGGAAGSWNLEATDLTGHGFFKITIDPDDPTLVYAATSHGLYQRPTTGDSFTTWNQVNGAFTNVNGVASDFIVAGTGKNKLYYAAFWGDTVYSSPDGRNWTAISGISGAGRIVVAAGENDPTVIYALVSNGSLYRLDRGINGSFQLVRGIPKALFFGNQGNYDIVLAVDPTNADTVYLGGDITWDGNWTLSFYKGTITGGPGNYTFPFNSANDIFTNSSNQRDSSKVPSDPTWIGRSIHPDIHAMAFATNPDGRTHDGSIVWVGTDGGLFQSTTGGSKGSFTARNTGMAVLEMTYIAQRADTDAVLFGGCQDNGTLRYWGEQAWYESPQGDGGGVAIDPNNPYRIMRQYTKTRLYTCTDGGASGNWQDLLVAQKFPPITANTKAQSDAAQNEGKKTSFYGPIAVSPQGVNPTLAAFGTNRLWLTSDWGETWVTLPAGTNPYAPATPNEAQDVLDGTPIRAIAFASEKLIFAATQNQVWRFDNTGSGWTSPPTPIPNDGLPPNHIITALAVVSSNGGLYITLGGKGIDHVWFYDGSEPWHSAGLIASKLDVPAHAVVVDPAHPLNLYIGTDVGCWKGIMWGWKDWTWELFSQGLPESAITDLAIHTPARLLRAATHGRGVWEIPLDDTSGRDPDIYMRASYVDSGRMPNGVRAGWVVSGAPDPYHPNPVLVDSFDQSADIKVRRGSLPVKPPLSKPPNYLDFAVNIGDTIGPAPYVNLMTADKSGTNQVFIQVHNRGLTPVPGSQVVVLLLISVSSSTMPNDYASHINLQDTTTTWLDSSQWAFADPKTPYRKLPGNLDVRTPRVVVYGDIDFSTMALNPIGGNLINLVAFVTTTDAADQLTSTYGRLDEASLNDKHIVYRLIQLV